MARPKSEDKRNAIIEAATRVVAEQGGSATTARIAKEARIAEGTLFTYFANKDALLNQLYLELKGELRDVMLAGYPASADLRSRAWHAWHGYIGWGVAHPDKRRAMARLGLSERITDACRATANEAFGALHAALEEASRLGALRDCPSAFVGAIMSSLAEATMDCIAREPVEAERYCKAGFDAFWQAIASR